MEYAERKNNRQEFLKIFSVSVRKVLEKMNLDFKELQEIRLRVNCPIMVLWNGKEYFIRPNGEAALHSEEGYRISRQEILETMEYISGYSLYAYEEELRQGFLTIQGGHRIGVAGQVLLEHGKVKNIKCISFLNIRLSHQMIGCADSVMRYIRNEEELCHTLLISPPGGGKTTLLRDMIRQVSLGTRTISGKNVGVVDERSELAGSVTGIPQNDLGPCVDVLDGCPKAEGVMMLIRSMAPEVIAVDEIGTENDMLALEKAVYCGCRILATVHGTSLADIKKNLAVKEAMKKHIFERYIVLGNAETPGLVRAIYDENEQQLYQCREMEK